MDNALEPDDGMIATPCPYCNSDVEFTNSSKVYNGRDYGMIYLCRSYPECDAFVGVHKGTSKPLGRLADKELRAWKKKAHAVFDPLWQKKLANRRKERGAEYKKQYARGSGYKWLAGQLGIEKKDCHIGMFDVEQCKRVVEICSPFYKKKEHKTKKINRDPNAGKYKKYYASTFNLVKKLLSEFGGKVEWSNNDYEAFAYVDDEVSLVFYPHKTKSTGNTHLRVRNQNRHNTNKNRSVFLLYFLSEFCGLTVKNAHYSNNTKEVRDFLEEHPEYIISKRKRILIAWDFACEMYPDESRLQKTRFAAHRTIGISREEIVKVLKEENLYKLEK